MVPVITLGLMYTLASYQLAEKREVEARQKVVERERAHIVRLISE